MNFNVSKPGQALSPYVKYFWALENCLLPGICHTQRIVPSGLFEIIIYLNDKPLSTSNTNKISDNSIVSGQQSEFYDLQIAGNLSLFAIYFYPHGLSVFLNLPLKELFNQSVPLKFILKDKITKLEDDLAGANTFDKRILIAEKFLLEQLKKTEKKYKLNRVRHSINLINQNKGNVDIEWLASESCLSRKQFERIFLDIIGISPKQFLKIVRFQHAIHLKSKSLNDNFTELAYNCGYYDQTHMTNDFKSLSGFSPKQFFNGCEPFSDYFV